MPLLRKDSVFMVETSNMKEVNGFRRRQGADTLMFNQIKPLLLFMCFLGILPISLPTEGKPSFSPILMAYAVCIHGPLTVIGCFILHDCITDVIVLKLDYIRTLFYIMIITSTAASMTTFLLVWLELGKFIRYLNSWTEFQLEFKKVTGKTFCPSIRRASNFNVIRCLLAGSTSLLFYYLSPYISLWSVPSYFDLFGQINAHIALWVLLCKSLVKAGKLLSKEFKDCLSREERSAKLISEYRLLWLQLSRLVVDTGNALSKVTGMMVVMNLFMVTLMAYGFLYEIITRSSSDEIYRSYCMGAATLSICITYCYICNCGHVVQKTIRDDVRDSLQNISLWKESVLVQNEIKAFLHTMDTNPPVISVGGVINVERGQFASFASRVVTYLIVLVQFNTEQPSKTAAQNNTRNETQG